MIDKVRRGVRSAVAAKLRDVVGLVVFFFQAEDGIRDVAVTGVQTCALPISFEIQRGKEGDEFKLREARDATALLLGRVTYEGFAAAWPSRKEIGRASCRERV